MRVTFPPTDQPANSREARSSAALVKLPHALNEFVVQFTVAGGLTESL